MPRLFALIVLALLLPAAAAAADAPAPRPAGIHYVYLIRHGIYDLDTTVTDDALGNGLNALGHRQAKYAGKRLAALPVKVHRLISSTYLRAAQTADDIGAVLRMAPERDSLIHECTPTSDRADYMKNHAADEIAACDANLNAAWAKYLVPTPDADTHDVLVCHGNVIRWMVSKALMNDTGHWTRMDIGNGSLTVLAVRPDGSTRLVIYSDVGHIPLAEQTWTGKGAGWGVAKPGMK